MDAVLILNCEAGTCREQRDTLTPALLSAAFAKQAMPVTVSAVAPAAIRQTIQQAVAGRPDVIFLAGGDGTISTGARLLAGTGVALGVVPLGTLNHFARDLGLPTDWRAAIAALATGIRRTVDVGEVNGHIFINNCSLGSYPEAVRKRELLRQQHGRGKWAAMFLASIAVFRRLRRLRVSIETPDTSIALRTPFVIVGNNCYSGHLFDHSLRPRLDEGRLWIYTTRVKGRLPLLRLAWQSFVRSIDAADALETHAVTAATLRSVDGRPLPIALDGELADIAPPLHFKSRAGALTVISPLVKEGSS